MTTNDPAVRAQAPVEAPIAERRRVRARVEGTVQGVGFRPHVHRLVTLHGLHGFVRNDERGVVLEVEGDRGSVVRFLERLETERPPLATVDAIAVEELSVIGERGFHIVESARGAKPSALVSADTATCDDCLRELFDPADRRYRYPFINCTNCGPRFTIVECVPYDRAFTTMSTFVMCSRCSEEYDDPSHRRFHAQPNACPECGPRVRLTSASGHTLCEADEAMRTAARAIRDGRILAVKGLGGFHLACRADTDAVVSVLRSRKRRESKAFAVMVSDLEAARAICRLDSHEEQLLLARDRPILLAARRPDATVAASVAPGLVEVGIMLPYTPLHHVLLADLELPIILTSGNLSSEPIAYRDDDASTRLSGLVDLFLTHDRPIRVPADDSIVRALRIPVCGRDVVRTRITLRRSRGQVPAAIELPIAASRPILGCGAELKSTFCVARGNRAWISHHLGDLTNHETFEAYRAGIEHFQELFAVDPEVTVHDLHPDYLSTSYAERRDGGVRLAIQHHHAHFAAVLAEHGEQGPAVGVIFDWSGLRGARSPICTVGWHLFRARGCADLPSSVMGVPQLPHSEPQRTSRSGEASWWSEHSPPPNGLAIFGRCVFPAGIGRRASPGAWLVLGSAPPRDGIPRSPPRLLSVVGADRSRAVTGLIESGLSAPWTTSMGRLFDAVAALCGICPESTYEGQAAMELEAISDPSEARCQPIAVVRERVGSGTGGTGRLLLDPRPTIRAVVRGLARGVRPVVVAARFHNGVAEAVAQSWSRPGAST